jgi:hypothetical protein
MTITIPKNNLFDRILGILGKRRGIIVPAGVYREYGYYSYALAKRENFFSALIRSKNTPLPVNVLEVVMFDRPEEKNRRGTLFCHDLLNFLESQYRGALFGDDFQGKLYADFYFIWKKYYYLVEAKGEIETSKNNHPGWKGTFQNIRHAINKIGLDNRYSKWLLYLAQLNDYACHSNQPASSLQCEKYFLVLGLPQKGLNDCIEAIHLAQKNHDNKFRYEIKRDCIRQLACIVTEKEELSIFFNHLLAS